MASARDHPTTWKPEHVLKRIHDAFKTLAKLPPARLRSTGHSVQGSCGKTGLSF